MGPRLMRIIPKFSVGVPSVTFSPLQLWLLWGWPCPLPLPIVGATHPTAPPFPCRGHTPSPSPLSWPRDIITLSGGGKSIPPPPRRGRRIGSPPPSSRRRVQGGDNKGRDHVNPSSRMLGGIGQKGQDEFKPVVEMFNWTVDLWFFSCT